MTCTKDIGILIKNLDESLKKSANSYFKTFALTFSQVNVLGYIDSLPEKCATQKELETYLNVSHPTINGILKRLEEKGIIETKVYVNKRLNKSVVITEKGKELGRKLEANKNEQEKILEQYISKEEKEKL